MLRHDSLMRKSKSNGNLILSWKSVGIVSTCTATALAVSLLVSSEMQSSTDALASIALALAIITFVVQIIVFIGQTSMSSQQLARAEELHGLTSANLASIVEKTEGTRQAIDEVRVQNNDHLRRKQLDFETKEENLLDLEEPKSDDEMPGTEASSLDTGSSPSIEAQNPNSLPRTLTTVQRAPRGVLLKTTDADESNNLIEEMELLNDNALLDLVDLGLDFIRFSETASRDGLSTLWEEEILFNRNFARRVVREGTSDPVWILTEKGQKAASLLRNLSSVSSPRQRKLRARANAKRAHYDLLVAESEIESEKKFPPEPE